MTTTLQENAKRRGNDQEGMKQMLLEFEQTKKEIELERQQRVKYEKQVQSAEQVLNNSKIQVEAFQKNSK